MLMFVKKYSIVALMMIMLVLVGCSVPKAPEDVPIETAPSETPEGQESMDTEKTKIVELVTLQYPPYEYEEDGQIKGIAVDIVKEGFERMGYNTNIQLLPWSRALEMVQNGEADGIFTAYKTPEREAFSDYSNEILMPQIVSLFVNADSEIMFDGDLSQLSNYKIGIVRGVSYGEKFDALVKEKKLTIEEADTGEANMDKLMNKRFDILISNKYGALAILKQKGKLEAVKELEPQVQNVPSYIAFSKARNLSKMRDEFDIVLAEMIQDGTVDRYIEDYIK